MTTGRRLFLLSAVALGIAGIGLTGEQHSGNGWFAERYKLFGRAFEWGMYRNDSNFGLGFTYGEQCRMYKESEMSHPPTVPMRRYHIWRFDVSDKGLNFWQDGLYDPFSCK